MISDRCAILHRYDLGMTANFAHSGDVQAVDGIDLDGIRADGAAKAVVSAWRSLSGAGRTLVACSGGADSAALALALASKASSQIVLGHVVHDMRPAADSHADRDAVKTLADGLQLPCVIRDVVIPSGNTESGARSVRYAALEAMAMECKCAFVATGHHADDQLESILLALGRGAGLKGLRGAASLRLLGNGGVRLIRPMLAVSHADARRICRVAGIVPSEDATNFDDSRRRAAVRLHVLPELRRIVPNVSRKSADAASIIADAARVVEDRARLVFGDEFAWPRRNLTCERRIVIGEGLRAAFRRLAGDAGADRLPRREIEKAIDAVCDHHQHVREFHWPEEVSVVVGAGLVTMLKESERDSE